MASPLSNAIGFLNNFGFYDVVLPFLLVFTIVFAVLEKTRIFGTEGEKKLPKKNINAMIAFVIALFFVATPKLVSGVQESLPVVAVVLTILMSFMMLVGFFYSDKEFSFENNKGWKIFLTFVMFIGIVLIFMHAFWLDAWKWLFEDVTGSFLTSTAGVTIIFLIIIVVTVLYITWKKKGD